MLTHGMFEAAFRKGLDAVAFAGSKAARTRYQDLTNAWRKENGSYAEYQEFGDLGLAREKAIGAPVTDDQPTQGFHATYYFITLALGLTIPQEVMDDDRHGVFQKYVRRLGGVIPKTLEQYAARIFNSGNATTYYSCPNGNALFYDTHKLTPTAPANYDTLLTPTILSATGLQAALTAINTRKDEHSLPVDETPVKLVLPPALEFKGAELLKSTFSPEDDSRHINAVKSERNLQMVVWKSLSSSTSWFIICEEHGIVYILRMPVTTGSGMDFASGNRMYKVVQRSAFGLKHPRGVLGVFN